MLDDDGGSFMSRQDRLITDKEEMIKIIEACQVVRIGMMDEDEVYILPMNFGYTWENEELVFYLHGALEGRKMEVLKKCPKVGFELDCEHELVEGKLPCQYVFKFASVVGNGTAELVEDPQEKMRALSILMKHVSEKEFEFNEKLVSIVSVVKVKATSFTGRRRS